MLRRPPRPPPFPYTTLFRSLRYPSSGVAHLDDDAVFSPRPRLHADLVLIDMPLGYRVGRIDEKVDRKSTRLNSSHSQISYAVFCLRKKMVDTPDPLPPTRAA